MTNASAFDRITASEQLLFEYSRPYILMVGH